MAREPGKRRQRLLVAVPFVVLVLWFAYLWFVSGVVPSVEKWPDGTLKATGYVERHGLSDYRRSGRWTTYHPDGEVSGTGLYENGEKLEHTWEYFDSPASPSNEAATPATRPTKT